LSFKYPKHVSFTCERCALCCRDTERRARSILLLETEVKRISEETSLSIEEFAERIRGFEPYVYRMRKTEDGKCVFLKDNLCSIYRIRPLICRFYPFQLKNLGNDRYVFKYTEECPGIGKGKQLKPAFFDKLFKKFMKAMEEKYEQ